MSRGVVHSTVDVRMGHGTISAPVCVAWAQCACGEHLAWVPAPLWRRLRAVALDLAAAVTATLAREGVVRAAEALGVHRDTLHAWRAPGGWLHAAQEVQS